MHGLRPATMKKPHEFGPCDAMNVYIMKAWSWCVFSEGQCRFPGSMQRLGGMGNFEYHLKVFWRLLPAL